MVQHELINIGFLSSGILSSTFRLPCMTAHHERLLFLWAALRKMWAQEHMTCLQTTPTSQVSWGLQLLHMETSQKI